MNSGGIELKDNLFFLIIIVGRKQKDALLSALPALGIRLIHTKYGKGTANANYLQNTLGLVLEEKKAVITCLSTRERTDSALQLLSERFHFDKPNTGIAFTLPIDQLSF